MNIFFPIIETFSPLIPLLTYFFLKPGKQKWITTLVIYSCIYIPVIAYANILQQKIIPNNGYYVFITVFNFFCYGLLIYLHIFNKIFYIIHIVVSVLVTVFAMVNAMLWEKLNLYNSTTSTITCIVLIFYCLFYFIVQLRNPKSVFIYKEPSFWVVSGILIYCGNFFMFSYYRTLLLREEWNFANNIWYVTDCIILTTNIFFAKAIACTSKSRI